MTILTIIVENEKGGKTQTIFCRPEKIASIIKNDEGILRDILENASQEASDG